jgi:hypothetical protein
MTDYRMTPDPDKITERTPAQIGHPVTDIRRRPDGPRDRQLIFGDTLTLFGTANGWSYIQSEKDGYCGHVRAEAIADRTTATHRVTAPATHCYTDANLKSPDTATLTFGSAVMVTEQASRFARTSLGFIPIQHLSPVETLASDPCAVATLFLGTPYLWGGNSRWGIDCSGLVQAACLACGIPCAGDSDQQAETLGTALPPDTPFARNDVIFWKGHVAIVSDPETILHSNGHTMSTNYEPLRAAIDRIARTDGPVTAHRRIVLPNGKKSPAEP